jgi:anaerobic C4-dicarboxylate transporter
MRKITLAGIAAVAAFGVAWSASTFAKSRVGKAEVVAASIAPHEIMVQLGRSLP